jgi:hypothetical protein
MTPRETMREERKKRLRMRRDRSTAVGHCDAW